MNYGQGGYVLMLILNVVVQIPLTIVHFWAWCGQDYNQASRETLYSMAYWCFIIYNVVTLIATIWILSLAHAYMSAPATAALLILIVGWILGFMWNMWLLSIIGSFAAQDKREGGDGGHHHKDNRTTNQGGIAAGGHVAQPMQMQQMPIPQNF